MMNTEITESAQVTATLHHGQYPVRGWVEKIYPSGAITLRFGDFGYMLPSVFGNPHPVWTTVVNDPIDLATIITIYPKD